MSAVLPSVGGPVVTIPRAALRQDEHGTYVWLVADGHVRRHAVTTGAELGDQVQILDGLAGGEALASGDASRLRDGGAVRIAEPAKRP